MCGTRLEINWFNFSVPACVCVRACVCVYGVCICVFMYSMSVLHIHSTLAGSTIMLLTIPWLGSLILGRVDIINGQGKDKTCSPFRLSSLWTQVRTILIVTLLLKGHPEFSRALYQNLLIGVHEPHHKQ